MGSEPKARCEAHRGGSQCRTDVAYEHVGSVLVIGAWRVPVRFRLCAKHSREHDKTQMPPKPRKRR